MRKIVSKDSEEKRKKRNQIILGVILVFVMFGSVFGVIVNSFGSKENSKEGGKVYRGVEFAQAGGYWIAEIGGVEFVFSSFPDEVADVPGEVNGLSEYINQNVYVYSESPAAEIEIYRNLQNIALKIQGAYPEGVNQTKDLPVKTCEEKFIIIRESNETGIEQDEGCVYISGKKGELVNITDEFLFKAIGLK